MHKNRLKIAFVFVSGLSTPLLVSSGVEAQGVSVSLYPPVIKIDTSPPSSPLVPITLQNNNSEDIVLDISLIPFSTNNSTGEIQLVPDLINHGFYPYYRERIQFLVDGKKTDKIQLKALEKREIQLNINLSNGDPPGDYYYSISFINQGTSPQGTSVSQLPAGIASNLLLSVGPKGTATGGIAEFTTDTFVAKGPVDFTLKLHNASKHLVEPIGYIRITNIFNQNVGTVNILPQYVLAGKDRYLTDEKRIVDISSSKTQYTSIPKIVWNESFLLGWYKAEASIKLDDTSSALHSTTYFISFPLYLFFPLVLVLFICISIYLKVKKKI